MAGEFDLHQLLAGPIIAMNDAQADAAASFYELFDQFAFEPAAATALADEPRRLRTISFVAERATSEGLERRQISMPLLQLIPIGGVGIDTARIQFSLALNAEPASDAPANRAPAAPARAVAMKARIAPTAAAAAPTGNLQVEIVLKQMDLPAGYLDMIAETHGGVSRLMPARDAAADPKPEAPLFTATVREASAPSIVPGRPHVLMLEIVPNPRLIGPKGLDLGFVSEPRRALTIRAAGTFSNLGTEPRTDRVELLLREPAAESELALLISGAAVGPDGVQHEHSIRIPLSRAGPEIKKG
jgi:hypothetical protein